MTCPVLRFFSVALVSFVFLGGGGCTARVSTNAIRSDISSGALEQLEVKMKKAHAEHHEFVTALNLARLYQLTGEWQKSIATYDSALSILNEYEGRAQISIRNALGSLGSVLVSKGSEGYYGTGYERSLLHTFNAINYLMLNDFSGAAVEMRKMEARQEQWLEETEERLRAYAGQLGKLEDILNDGTAQRLARAYQDPFSYSLSSIVCRLAGDTHYASVSLKRAEALEPQVSALFEAAWGKNKAGGAAVQALGERQSTTGKKTKQPAQQEVTVIFTSGLAPALYIQQTRIAFQHTGYIMVDMPAYYQPSNPGVSPYIIVSDSETGIATLPLLQTEILAYRTLEDERIFEIASALSRAAFRSLVSGTARAAASSNANTQKYATLIGVAVNGLFDLYATLSSSSVRNWEMLPNKGFLSMARVPVGSTVTVAAAGLEQKLTLPQESRGVIINVSMIANYRMRMDYVLY